MLGEHSGSKPRKETEEEEGGQSGGAQEKKKMNKWHQWKNTWASDRDSGQWEEVFHPRIPWRKQCVCIRGEQGCCRPVAPFGALFLSPAHQLSTKPSDPSVGRGLLPPSES